MCAFIGKSGNPAAFAVKACDGAELPRKKPGNSGQVIGAVRIGVVPCAAFAIIAAICIAIAQ